MKKITKKIVLTLASVIALGTIGVVSANYNPTNATTSVIRSSKKTKLTIPIEETSKNISSALKSALDSFRHGYYTVDVVFPDIAPDYKQKITYRSMEDLNKQISDIFYSNTGKQNTTENQILFTKDKHASGRGGRIIQVEVKEVKKKTPEEISKTIMNELPNQNSVIVVINYPDPEGTGVKKITEELEFESVADLEKQILAKTGIKNPDEYEISFTDSIHSTYKLNAVYVDIRKKDSKSASTDSKATNDKDDSTVADSKKADSKETDDKKADGKETNGKDDDKDDGKETDSKKTASKSDSDSKATDGKETESKKADSKADGKENDRASTDDKDTNSKSDSDSKATDSKKESGSKSDDDPTSKSTKKSDQLSTDKMTQEISERLSKQNSVTVVIYYGKENYQKEINYNSPQDLAEKILNLVSKQNNDQNMSKYKVYFRNSSSNENEIVKVFVEVK